MKKKFFLILIAGILTFSQALYGLTASVAVPCYYKHFKFLPPLLSSLTEQTQLPEEVVISLSQVENLFEEDLAWLEKGPWPFHVHIIRRAGVFMEGDNRTTAARHCCGDVILCIDADDIPHPQRIEAVLQLFEAIPEADMVLCGHAYCPEEAVVCEPAIPFYTAEEYRHIRFDLSPKTWSQLHLKADLMHWSTGVHNGSPSLRRRVIEEGAFWSDLKNGADIEFNHMMIEAGHPSYLIQVPLLHYYNGRSSGADIGRE